MFGKGALFFLLVSVFLGRTGKITIEELFFLYYFVPSFICPVKTRPEEGVREDDSIRYTLTSFFYSICIRKFYECFEPFDENCLGLCLLCCLPDLT